MKCVSLSIVFTVMCILSFAQPLIHAHNDYQKAEPLTNAVRHKIFSIEADIYLYNNKLVVAHDKKELPTARPLDSLYLKPIISLFKKYKGTISKDRNYAPVLMIDIKENGEAVLAELIKLLSVHSSVFDRSVNKKALQVVISGDRTISSKWSSYPAYILFDGRPYETYDSAAMKRIAFVSDSYAKYITSSDSSAQLNLLAKKVHAMGKMLRLWATPDDPRSWKQLQQLGIDIINTDKPAECRSYLYNKQSHHKIK